MLRVGVGSIVPSILLPFQELHPEIEVSARYIESVGDPELLLDGTLDIVESADFYYEPDDGRLLFTPVSRLPMYCLFAPNHALSSKPVVTVRDLAGQVVYIANPRFLSACGDEGARDLMRGVVVRGGAFGRSDMIRCKCEGGVFIAPKFSASIARFAFQMESAPFDFRPTTFGLLTRRSMTDEEGLLVDFYKTAFAGDV